MTRHIQHIAILIVLKALGAQRYTLIQTHVVADDGSLANYHTRTMIDREIFADLCSWVDIDSSLRVSQLRDDSWDHRHLQLVKLVGHAIVGHRIHHRITEDDLAIVGYCRIIIEHSLYIGIQQSLNLRQFVDECHRLCLGLVIHLFLGAQLLAVLTKLQSVGYLLGEQRYQLLHMHTDVVRADSLIRLSLVEVIGKYDALHQFHDLLHLLYRWQRSYCGGHHTRLFLRNLRQLRHIPAQGVIHLFLIHIGGKSNNNRSKTKIK